MAKTSFRDLPDIEDKTLFLVMDGENNLTGDPATIDRMLERKETTEVRIIRLLARSAESEEMDDSEDEERPKVKLTVEEILPENAEEELKTGDSAVPPDFVDPLSQLDTEQVLKLKKALASEQAKQLLGDNVTAMLDVLSVDDSPAAFLQNSIRRDHCYTPLSPSADPRGASFLLTAGSNDAKKTKGRPKADSSKPSVSGLNQLIKPSVALPAPSKSSDIEEEDENSDDSNDGTSEDIDSDDRDRSSDSDYRENSSSGLRGKKKSRRGPWGSRRMRGGVQGKKSLRGRGRTRLDNEEITSEVAETSKVHSTTSSDPSTSPALKRGRPRKSEVAAKSIASTTTASTPEPSVVIPIDHVAAKVYSADAIRLGRPQVKSEEERKRDMARIMHKLDASGPKIGKTKPKMESPSPGTVHKTDKLQFKVIAVSDKKALPKTDDELSQIETLEGDLQEDQPSMTKVAGKPLRTYVQKDESNTTKKASDVLSETTTPKDTLTTKVPAAGNVMGGKYPRRENRKLPSHFADTIGPELFSSPDVARRRVQITEESVPNKSKVAGKVVQKSLLKYVVKSSSPSRNSEVAVESTVLTDENISNVSTLTQGDSLNETVESTPDEGEPLLSKSPENGLVTNKDQPKSEKNNINANAKPLLDSIKGDKIILGKNVNFRRRSSTKSENVDDETKKSHRIKNESASDNVLHELAEKSPKDDVKQKKSDNLEQKSSRRTSRDTKPTSRHEKVLSKHVESKPIVENSHKIVRADIVKTGSSKVVEAAAPLTQEGEVISPTTEDRRRNAVKRRRSDEVSNLDSDTDDTLSEASWNSEDDPERLWCICRKPHNNRFMICCDLCEDWFHGKCVGITKSIGKQMEQDGLEWSCPPCTKKKQAEEKEKESKSANKVPEMKQTKLSGFSIKRPSVEGNERKCIMCKAPVRETSIYCSDKCIQSHSLKAIAQLGSANQKTSSKAETTPASTSKPDRHVIVMDPVSKKVLAGSSAPTLKNLATWLKDNPSYHVLYQKRTNTEVASSNVKEEKKMMQLPSSNKLSGERSTQSKLLVSPNSKHIKIISRPAGSQAIQIIPAGSMKKNTTVSKPASSSGADVKSKTSESLKSSEKKEVETPKKSHRRRKEKHNILTEFKSPPSSSSKMEDREKGSGTGEQVIRDSVRKTLGEALKVRKADCADLKSKEIDIESLASKIEERLYKLFDNKVDVKYKSKYRSLVFNIKDVKNKTLYRKILENSISPKELVRLTADEMASQELAQWREKENQHQLEMIKKTELELMALGQTFILKSHKGEEVIEKDQKVAAVAAALDPNTSAKELVSAINSVTSTTPDTAGENEKVKGSETSLMKMNKKEKERQREKERKYKRNRSRSRSRSSRHSKRKKNRSRSKDRHRRSNRSKSRSFRDSRDKDKDKDRSKDTVEKEKEIIKKAAPVEEEPVEISTSADVETKFKEIVSDDADYEPTSTVSIKTPETFPEEQDDINELASVWAGQIIMPDVAKFHGIALESAGDCNNVDSDVSDQVSVVGRIPYNTVWEYIERMKKIGKDVIVMQILPIDIDVDKSSFLTLFNYLSKRGRIAVIGRCSEQVKDFYLYPHVRGNPLPEVISSITIPSTNSEQILLGIIVKMKRGARSASSLPLPPVVAPQCAKLPLPLPLPKSPIVVPEPAIISPPVVASTNTDPRKRKIKVHVEVTKSPSPASVEEGDSPYSPASSDEDLPPLSKMPRKAASIKKKPTFADTNLTAKDGSIAAAAQIQKKIEEMNRAIEEETKQIKNLASSVPVALHVAVNPALASVLNVNVPPPVPQLDLALKALQTLAASKDLATPIDKESESVRLNVPATDPATVELDIPLPPSPPPPPGIGMEDGDKSKEQDQQPSGSTSSASTLAPLLLPEVAQISIPSNLQDILANINKQSKPPTEKVASSPPLSPKSPEPLPPGVDDSDIPKLPVKTKPDRSAVFEGEGVLSFTPSQKKPIKFDLKLKSRDLDERQIGAVDVHDRSSAPVSSLDQRIALALDQDDRVISSVSSSSDRDERVFRSADLSAISSRDKDDRLSRFQPTSDKGDRGFRRQDRWKNDSHKRRADRNSRESKWKDDLEDEWSGSIRRHEDEARRRSRSIRAKEIQMLKHNADHDSD